MTRLLTLTIAAAVTISANASAYDGSQLYSHGGCGCSGQAFSPTAFDRIPLSPSGCRDGACPAFDWQQNRGIRWNGPQASPGYNAAPTYRDEPQYVPQHDQPLTPRTNPAPYTPPLPSQADRSPSIPQGMEGIAQLPIAEQRRALQQRTCPVTREPLGSMGKPISVTVAGRSVYVCCEGCVNALQRNPERYLTGALRGSIIR
ncbi:MAG: hypothetical protein KDA93_18185 [Planctomycetaceae bacterium]|nr:hypothetical protein [Planctomycetaceae bacterium]